MRRFSVLGTVVLVLVFTLFSTPIALAQSPAASSIATPAAVASGIQIADMDLAVDPTQDFWAFANGGWLERAEIPADEGRFGASDELVLKTIAQQLAQLDALMQSDDLLEGSDQWKVVRFFEQGIDMETRNAQGIAPLQPQLDIIASATDLQHLHDLMASSDFGGIPDFFGVEIGSDPADSTLNTLWLWGPALGLPDETFYTGESENTAQAREAYKAVAARFLQRLGMPEADAVVAAQAVYDFEAAMAAQMVTAVESQDFTTVYNPTTLDEMQALYPAIDWQAYLTAFGAPVDGSSIVIDAQQRLMQNLPAILAETEFQTIQNYLTVQLMLVAVPFLDQQMRDIDFGLQQVLTGAQEQEPLERRVLKSANRLMPDALGQLYVAEYFSPEARAEVEQLVDNLIAAFRVRIQNNAWMSQETKTAAIEKLDGMRVKVGYPDTWKSYEDYIVGDSYWATFAESKWVENLRRMGTYGQPVDKSEWWMSPQTVNAGYSAQMNDITFPAAFLQAPFFDADADLASNYGGLGATIGHEITHGFDLRGAQFDKDGNFANWWTEADRAAFAALNQQVAAQYAGVEVLPGLFIDGQLTVTENVADMGGLQVAFDALRLALQQEGDPGDIDGFTQDQRFFIAYAQSWQETARPESLRLMVQSDAHAPAFARGTLPAENMDAFSDAFGIQPGDPMYLAPEDRIVIW